MRIHTIEGTYTYYRGGMHRSGGAAQAVVPNRLFKRHGRWSSDSTKDGYIVSAGTWCVARPTQVHMR